MASTAVISFSYPPALSPDGCNVAFLASNKDIHVRRITTLDLIKSVEIPASGRLPISIIWSPLSKTSGFSDRFLAAQEDKISVWDLKNEEWLAVIDNGSGYMGKISHVEFGVDDSEVMVFSQFDARLTLWDLKTGKGVEVKDPKFAKGGHSRSNGPTPTYALLTRSGPQDAVSLYISGTGMFKTFSTPTTDAQGLKWSPDGRWLAVWDTPAMGYKVLIYTADGNLFRCYTGDYYTDEMKGLGAKSVEWSPDGHFLAVAGYEKHITLLSTKTFGIAAHLSHPKTANPAKTNIFQEQLTPSRSYARASQLITPPSAPASDSPIPKIGASILAFSCDGALLASRDDSMPTAVWIWDLGNLSCSGVLLQHEVVQKLLWHPTDPNILLVQCRQKESVLYSWDANENVPRVLEMPTKLLSGKTDAQWVPKQAERKPIIMLSGSDSFAFAYPDGRDASPTTSINGGGSRRESREEETENDSEDSLFEILSGGGKTMGKNAHEDRYDANGFLEDTFRFKSRISAAH